MSAALIAVLALSILGGTAYLWAAYRHERGDR